MPSAKTLKEKICNELDINENDVGELDDACDLYASRLSDLDLLEFLQK